MKNIYACILGNWVNLSDDPDCTMGQSKQSPHLWYEEGAEIWSPIEKENKDTYYQLDYVWIYYKGKSYCINPVFIQIVEE